MSKQSGAMGFGGFLLGLGIGYIAFRQLSLTFNDAAWVFIILGAAIILSAGLRAISPNLGLHRVVGGLVGGLVLALVLTQGFNFMGGINVGNPFLPFSRTETKTYTGASMQGVVDVELGSVNGGITLSTWDKEEYSITSTITARGTSQQDADNNLASLEKELSKIESSTLQELTLIYSSDNWVNNPYQIDVDIKLPTSAVLYLDFTTSNGRITIRDVNGGDIDLQTSNSEIQLNNVIAETINAETSNSPITGTVEATDCELSTSNSAITIKIGSGKSGDYDLETSNSSIDVTIPDVECRLDASTSNSDITFNVPNLTYSDNSKNSKRGQTAGFDSASLRVSVDAQTSNSAIRIHR